MWGSQVRLSLISRPVRPALAISMRTALTQTIRFTCPGARLTIARFASAACRPQRADDNSQAAQLRRVAEQQAAFERFIEGSDCLRKQRGRIVERNSCRAPALHTSNLALRQSIPWRKGHSLSVQLEVFNILNLLDASQGLLKTPNAAVLEHVGQTSMEALGSDPVFRFNLTRPRFDWQNIESAYQLQLAVRYSF